MTSPLPPVSTMGTAVPYITVQELKRSPIYTQLQQLVPASSEADRDAELGRIIQRISTMINSEVNQNLAATRDVEIGQVTVSYDGTIRIHTRSNPIIAVNSIALGPDVYNLTPLSDLSHLVIEDWRIIIPRTSGGLSSGNLPLANYGRPGQRIWAQWDYINGYPHSVLSAAVAAGDTTITVKDATGITPNQTLLTIEDGKWLENVVPTAVNGNTLTVPALEYKHEAGTGITALPDDIKQAMFILVSRIHDTWSLSMEAIGGHGATVPGAKVVQAMCQPARILYPYKRMW